MKKILGLDLGTNSVGWALIDQDFTSKTGRIVDMGSRIIPMSQDILGEFGKGNSVSQTAERTRFRSTRRLRERHLLRRERLHRALNILGFLPKHYANQIDFDKRLGQFKKETEPKLPYNHEGFLFQNSFQEMIDDFRKQQPQFLISEKGEPRLISHDWTIYYLRKKALTQKIEKEELAWILLNFNQKRGYYQLRGEEEDENPNKLVEFYSLKVVDVIPDEKPNSKGETWYSLKLENGWIYRRSSTTPLYDWNGKTRDFIVTTDLNDDGTVKTDKEGSEKRSFRAPKEDDWTLLKKKTEQEIDKSKNTVGTYIYNNLLLDPKQKIRGKLVRTIERKFYKDELFQILNSQKNFHPELTDGNLYVSAVRELYKHNEAHQFSLSKRDFTHLFLDDIIFYQRPLRSKKSSVSNCSFECRTINKDGVERTFYLKAIPKSNPYYQEFRVWQWLSNLKIYRIENDSDVTDDFLRDDNDKVNLFEYLMTQKEVDHKDILKYFLEKQGLKGKALTQELVKYRWNYVFDQLKGESKKYPCNETGYEIRRRLSKVTNLPDDFLTRDIEQNLWHIIYSVTDKKEYEQALKRFAEKHELHKESFVENFLKFPPFKSDYGSYSEKAIKRLLPLLRLGKYWHWDAVDSRTQDRIKKLINGEWDETINEKVREKAINLSNETHFQGLQLWLATYVVYDLPTADKWHTVADLQAWIDEFRQHSLRNPIVEQVVTETLRVVKDIWQQYGNGASNFFDEIHVELGRDLKNTADERKRLTAVVNDNENTNLRIKALLIELMNDASVENVRPYSPVQQEILKIYEDGVLSSEIEIEDDILKISKKAEPSKSELQRYKLWLEQKYRSPYTGQIIPLNKLFTPEYEIEHIIPQSRYFDDSFSNKVICESIVNKYPYKDNYLGLEFIKKQGGRVVDELSRSGRLVTIFTETEYRDFVDRHYSKNRSKRNKLLMDDIPESMVARQLNDTRYISKYICELLSNIVRSEKNDEGINSKNLIPGNGKITTQLKQDWGLNDVWNDLILPRFERMNTITNSSLFTSYNANHQKYLPTVPFEYSKGFQKKRIDHRHHALDALVIACATKEHLNYMSNKHAIDKKKSKQEKDAFRYDLRNTLCYKKYNNGNDGDYSWVFKKPWDNFTLDAKKVLHKTVVSFKQNLRVINKATNEYESYTDENGKLRIGNDGKPRKGKVSQNGRNWAIRKQLHKDTVSGRIVLQGVKPPKDKILTATRKNLDSSFNLKTIESITDSGIRTILRNYLESKENKPELAFSPEGIEDMNNNIKQHNNGKNHQPIIKVRVYEVGSKFPLGETANKKEKFVEAAKGTNLFFSIYQDENGNRNYESLPLNEVIEHQKWRATLTPEEQRITPMVPIKNDKGEFLFYLSPNDLVYVPAEEEDVSTLDFKNPTKEQIDRIYKMVSCTGNQCFFIKHMVASSIVNKMEFSALNKMEKDINGTMVKEKCVKLKVDRLGNIISVQK